MPHASSLMPANIAIRRPITILLLLAATVVIILVTISMSGKNVGAKALSMNVATILPGGVAGAHVHVDFEVMLYILEGRVRHEYGDGLKLSVENEAGDFIFIEPGVPHEVFNVSDTEPVVAVVARSDASEWENIVPYERRK